jgi:phosphatidate cytidylyltransferase
MLVGLIVLNLFLLPVSPLFFALLVAVIIFLCVWELTGAFGETFPLAYRILNLAYAAAILPCYLLTDLSGVFALTGFALTAALVIFTAAQNAAPDALQKAALALIYPAALLSLIFPMIYSGDALFLLVAVFAIGPMSDTFAYAVGSIVKGKKLCPHVSPNKTVSGAIGGIFGGIAAGLLIYAAFKLFSLGATPGIIVMAIVGALGALFTEAGDLAESALKRKLGIKDFGNLLPGHGGVLDRVDGIMFNAAFIYIFFSYIIAII